MDISPDISGEYIEKNLDPLGDSPEELLRKYDVSAPRYTSYPPVPYWGGADGEQAQAWLAEKSSARDPSLSLYFHIPFCTNRCLYCGCFVIITPHKEQAEPYLEALKAEMGMVKGMMKDSRPVKQFHLGGGTPTYISPEQMGDLVTSAVELFPLAPDPEMSIEVDPRTMDEKYLTCLRELGFNRISLGVQDFDDKVMQTVNRIQPFDLVAKVVETARELGFSSVNFDLIYGLPEQTRDSFGNTLEQVGQLKPDRLAIYNYAHLPEINPYQRRLSNTNLPGPEEKTAIFLMARKKLISWGYAPIGLDHFALPEDDLSSAFQEGTIRRNFMGYSTQAGTDQLAFGISSISEFNRSFWQNEKKLNKYLGKIKEGILPVVRGMELNDEDLLRKEVISALFCSGKLDYTELGDRFGTDFSAHMAQELAALAPLAEDGLVELGRKELKVTPRGQLFLRNIATVFDTYMKETGGKHKFSRAL